MTTTTTTRTGKDDSGTTLEQALWWLKKLYLPNKLHISNRSSWPMFPGHWDPSVDGWPATTGDRPLCWLSPVILQSGSTINPAGPGFIKNYLHYVTILLWWEPLWGTIRTFSIKMSKKMIGNIMKHQDAKVEISYQKKCHKNASSSGFFRVHNWPRLRL